MLNRTRSLLSLLVLSLALAAGSTARADATTVFHVSVPDANAQVFFDETATTQWGQDRSYFIDGSGLDSRKTYHYKLKAAIEAQSGRYEKTMKLNFHVGDRVEVRFYWQKKNASAWVLQGRYSIAGADYSSIP